MAIMPSSAVTPVEIQSPAMARVGHIVHIVLALDGGGLERVVLDLIREGQRLGQRASVLCLERPGLLASAAKDLGCDLLCADKPPGLRPNTICKVRRLLAGLRPDVLHTHQVGALAYAGPAAWRAGVPVVLHTEHGKHYDGSRRRRWLARWAARYAGHFCCVSRDIADTVVALGIVLRSKVRVVANGIDTERFRRPRDRAGLRRSLGVPPDAPVIGTVGRLNEIKRQDVLLGAFARARQALPDAHLVLVGDGPLRPSLETLADRLGIRPVVHFTGFQAEPEAYLQVMDLFALTSRSEGMPLAVLEAWAAGTPVVSSRVGGIPELIREGETGLLFEPGNEAALAGILQRFFTNSELAGQLRIAGQHEVQSRFSLEQMARAYQRLYQELLGREV
jgi:sugar transferase (PEP-CTERM/EpsH1 system associated)